MVPVLSSWNVRRSALVPVRAAAVLLVWAVLWLSAMVAVLESPRQPARAIPEGWRCLAKSE